MSQSDRHELRVLCCIGASAFIAAVAWSAIVRLARSSDAGYWWLVAPQMLDNLGPMGVGGALALLAALARGVIHRSHVTIAAALIVATALTYLAMLHIWLI